MTAGANDAGAQGSLKRVVKPPVDWLRRTLAGSGTWQLWRARKLERRAIGPFEDGANEWSVISAPPPTDNSPSDNLVELAVRAINAARSFELKTLHERRPGDAHRHDRLAGQHYRILAGLAEAWGARRVVEVGTFHGTSALAVLDVKAVEHVLTYDIVAWDELDGTVLQPDDFGPRLEQRLVDLSDSASFATNAKELAQADMIFVDASKDGVFEPAFLEQLFALEPDGPQLVVLDDIRVLTMVGLWRSLDHDKIDLTSFGHWSGTGIVVRNGFPAHFED